MYKKTDTTIGLLFYQGLLMVLTNTFFKNRISTSLTFYSKRRRLLSWHYLYPSVTAYSLLLLAVIAFAAVLHFPRLAADFRHSRKPYEEKWDRNSE